MTPGIQSNIAQLFEEQVARNAEVIAVVWGDSQLTYGELNARANRLARLLCARGVGLESPVGVYMDRSPEMITALLAVVKAGGCYLPLDTTYPKDRLAFMLRDTGAQLMITQAALAGQMDVEEVCLEDIACELDRQSGENLAHTASGENIVYIMYTSGSTGQPKGIEILHRGVASLVTNASYAPLTPQDSVAQLSNCAFDASTWEIWGSLLSGARLVGVNKETALSPQALASAIETQGITSMFVTTALFLLMAKEAPRAFRSLRHLLTGGEALSPSRMREVLEHSAPQRLVHVYGPTEGTTFATWHLVKDIPEGAATVPIGKALGNTRAYVLDGKLRPVAAGETGELHIAGDGLARGYVKQAAMTAERFVTSPYVPSERLYRTGDLVRQLPCGALDFVGRADFQVKIRGFRIELGEIQTALRSHAEVGDVVVAVHEPEHGDKRLVAYVVPRDSAALASRSELTSALREHARKTLPGYMIPGAFVWMKALPLTPNGKVDRVALLSMDLGSAVDDREYVAPATETEIGIAAVWSRLLGVDRVSAVDNFFDIGGNSLLATQLVLRLEEVFLLDFPMRLFFASPKIRDMAAQIDALLAGKMLESAPEVDLRADCVLDESIRPASAYVDTGIAPRNIFLTGATGFLGAFLVDGLLKETNARIYCLVRARDEQQGRARICGNSKKYGLAEPDAKRMVPVLGDLTQTNLGLDDEQFAFLAANMDAVYHCAAHVSYIEPYALHRPVNVVGTQEVLRFACQAKVKPVHYISTIGLFGPVGYFAGVTDLYEDTDLDRSEPYLQKDMGYSMSKWVAEKLVFAARDRGLPVSIYRPGFIMGHSQTGVSNVDDFMMRLIVGCVEMGSYPGLSSQRKEFVPVDYVSDAIVHISCQRGTLGRNYHLAPPDPAKSVDLVDFFVMLEDFGYKLRGLPYAEWKSKLFHHVRRWEKSALLPLVSVLTERIHENSLTRWELHEKMPRFHSDNTRDALSKSNVTCQPMTRELLSTYVDYLIGRGLLPLLSNSRQNGHTAPSLFGSHEPAPGLCGLDSKMEPSAEFDCVGQ